MPIVVKGKISVRDEKEPQLMVDTLRPLTDADEPAPGPPPKTERTLWARLPSRDDERMKRIELVLKMFPGDERLIVYFEDTGKRIGTQCLIHDALIGELQELLGAENVVVR